MQGANFQVWVFGGHPPHPWLCKPRNSSVPQGELNEIKIWFVLGTLEGGGSHCLVSRPTLLRVTSFAARVSRIVKYSLSSTVLSGTRSQEGLPKERQEVLPLRWHSHDLDRGLDIKTGYQVYQADLTL